jgi:hypothetical protein
MQNHLTKSVSCLLTFATFLSLSALTFSLAHAQFRPTAILVAPFGSCIRPIGGSTADGVGVEAVLGLCSGDNSLFWSERQDGSWSWFINVKSGKCLDVQGTSVVQRDCDFGNLNSRWSRWFVSSQLRRSENRLDARCLTFNFSATVFYVGASMGPMVIEDCASPGTAVSPSQQFLSDAFVQFP